MELRHEVAKDGKTIAVFCDNEQAHEYARNVGGRVNSIGQLWEPYKWAFFSISMEDVEKAAGRTLALEEYMRTRSTIEEYMEPHKEELLKRISTFKS